MFFRLIMLAMVAIQVLFFVPGCEQVKEYRKKAYYEKARELYEEQDYRGALKETIFAQEFDENYFDAILLRAMCLYELKNYKAAAFAFARAVQVDDTRDDILLKSAEAFYKTGNWGQSKVRTTLLLEKNADNSAARCLESRNRLRSRRLNLWRKVDTLLQPLLDDAEYKEQAFALLAEFNILNDNLEEAEQILLEHASLNDDWFFVMRMLANKYDSLNDRQGALRMYSKALEVKPDSTQDIYSLLSILRKSGRKEDEQQLLVSLIAADGQQVRYTLDLIRFYMHYGQFVQAERLILAELEGGIRTVDCSKLLIDVYRKTNRLDAAIQVAKDVLSQLGEEEFETEIEFMGILAWLYYESNNIELAKAVIRWLLDLDSGNSSARYLLAVIAVDEGRTLLAIAELRGLVSEDIKNPEYDYYLGLAHMARGEKTNAAESFREALKKDPSHKRALLKVAELYFAQEEFVQLARKVEGFLAISPDDRDVLALQTRLAGEMMSPVPVNQEASMGLTQ